MPLRGRTQFDKNGNVYFITTTVMNFDNVFVLGKSYNQIIIDSLKYLICEHKAELFAYVIMPSHIHFMCYIPKGESIIDFMRDFKKYTSVKIRKLAQHENKIFLLERLRQNASVSRNQKYKLWMDRFDDLVITTERMMGIKANYIHNNPVKAKLVECPEVDILKREKLYIG